MLFASEVTTVVDEMTGFGIGPGGMMGSKSADDGGTAISFPSLGTSSGFGDGEETSIAWGGDFGITSSSMRIA